jgi:hypothetical protein
MHEVADVSHERADLAFIRRQLAPRQVRHGTATVKSSVNIVKAGATPGGRTQARTARARPTARSRATNQAAAKPRTHVIHSCVCICDLLFQQAALPPSIQSVQFHSANYRMYVRPFRPTGSARGQGVVRSLLLLYTVYVVGVSSYIS